VTGLLKHHFIFYLKLAEIHCSVSFALSEDLTPWFFTSVTEGAFSYPQLT